MIGLNNLPAKQTKSKQRVGRGNASRGTYSGRGQKGQRSRSGGKGGLKRLGAKSWISKLPKIKGMKSRQSKPELVDINKLETVFDTGNKITPKLLKAKGLISKTRNGVKILGQGPITKKFILKGVQLSASARQALEKAGGKVDEIEKVDKTKEKNKESKSNSNK